MANQSATGVRRQAETIEAPTPQQRPGLPAPQQRAIISAIMAGAAFGNTTSNDPREMVEIYHAVYKELRDKGLRPNI